MTRKTLLTPKEVIQFTGVNVNVTPCTFRELYNIELYEARKCIGYNFWLAMVAALADYSAEPEYVSGTTYAEDDIVKYQGVYKIALQSTSAVPTVSTDWENAPRFTGSCAESYDTLFCDFLAPYLAHKVLAARLPYIWTQIRDTGVVTFNGGQFEAVESGDLTRLQNAIYRDAAVVLGNLKHYMSLDAQEENTCFSLWPAYGNDENEDGCSCGASTCKTCNPKRRVGGYSFG